QQRANRGLGENDADQILLRRHPEMRAIQAAPAKAAFRQPSQPLGRIGYDADSESESFSRLTAGMRIRNEDRAHHLDAARAEYALALELAVVREHHRKARVILRSRHQAAGRREVALAGHRVRIGTRLEPAVTRRVA